MSKAVRSVGKAISGAVKSIGNIIKDVAPIAAPLLSVFAPGIGTAIGATLGASAAAAPIVGGAVLGAAGSAIGGQDPITGAVLGGGSAYLKGLLSPTVSSSVPEFGSAAADQAFIAADAAQLAGQGLSEAAIMQNLTFAGVPEFLAADAAQLAAQGLSQAAIQQNIAQSASPLGVSPSFSVQNAIRGFSGLNQLANLGRPQQQPMQMTPQMDAGTQGLLGQVDYSNLLGLLGTGRAGRPNVYSLLA